MPSESRRSEREQQIRTAYSFKKSLPCSMSTASITRWDRVDSWMFIRSLPALAVAFQLMYFMGSPREYSLRPPNSKGSSQTLLRLRASPIIRA